MAFLQVTKYGDKKNMCETFNHTTNSNQYRLVHKRVTHKGKRYGCLLQWLQQVTMITKCNPLMQLMHQIHQFTYIM